MGEYITAAFEAAITGALALAMALAPVLAALALIASTGYALAVAAGLASIPEALQDELYSLLASTGAVPAAGHRLHGTLAVRKDRKPEVCTVLSVRLLTGGRLQYSVWKAGARPRPRRFSSALTAVAAYYVG